MDKNNSDTNEKSKKNEQNKTNTADIDENKNSKKSEKVKKPLSLEEQLQEAKQREMRAWAEVENTRKIAEKDIAKIRKYGISPLAQDIFPVIDNLTMAITSISEKEKEENQTLKNLSIGLDMTLNQLTEALKQNKIEKITPKIGDDFDYNKHQAMSEIETKEIEPGKIAQVLQSGFMLHERLLKAAVVIIAKNIDKIDENNKKEEKNLKQENSNN